MFVLPKPTSLVGVKYRMLTMEDVGPNDLAIGSRNQIIAIIRPDGQIVYNEGYTPNDAARAFWESLASHRINDFEKSIISQHMEGLLCQLGELDLRCEQARLRALDELDPARKKLLDDAATLTTQQLEAVVGQAIELGRALALRDNPIPQIPEVIPESIQSEQSAYTGGVEIPPDYPEGSD